MLQLASKDGYTLSQVQSLPVHKKESFTRASADGKDALKLWNTQVFLDAPLRKRKTFRVVLAVIILICLLLVKSSFGTRSLRQLSPIRDLKFSGSGTQVKILNQEDGFVMITPTLGRTDLLPDFLSHYASGNITSLKAIIIQWVDDQNEMDEKFAASIQTYSLPIYVTRPASTSLNDRFKPVHQLSEEALLVSNHNVEGFRKQQFSNAIFSVDDDILIPTDDLEQAFNLFIQPMQGTSTNRMLGFFARKGSKEDKYITSYKPEYNMVLTKGAFIRHDWMELYWSDRFEKLRSFVTKNRNCEDILMSYIVADDSRTAPLFYLSKYTDLGLKNGISTQAKHYDFRSECIATFNTFFGLSTLISTKIMIKNLLA